MGRVKKSGRCRLVSCWVRDIWEFYSFRKRESVDEYGRQTIFQISPSFDFALKHYSRALIISVMLPFSHEVIEDYMQRIPKEGKQGSSHLFGRMFKEVDLMIDKATVRTAIHLVSDDTAVVPLDYENCKNIFTEAIPLMHQGASHGLCKEGNYPQKSVAVLMGLGQFGVSRIVFRDEIADGKVERLVGPLYSIVMFDKDDIVKDGREGIIYPSKDWRSFLFRLSDFTDTDPEINKYRFCTYIPHEDEGCGKCIRCCPSGAQLNSAPAQNGKFTQHLVQQSHRFWERKLQFDFGRCFEESEQMKSLFPEWSCSRCVSCCAIEGNRRKYAADHFYKKMFELTRIRE
jgi:hypothetical protein